MHLAGAGGIRGTKQGMEGWRTEQGLARPCRAVEAAVEEGGEDSKLLCSTAVFIATLLARPEAQPLMSELRLHLLCACGCVSVGLPLHHPQAPTGL